MLLFITQKAIAGEGFYTGGEISYIPVQESAESTGGPESGTGLGLILGYQLTPSWAFQITLSRVFYNVKGFYAGTDITVDSNFHEFIVGLKYAFLEGKPFRPFLYGGWGKVNLKLEDAAAGNAEFSGWAAEVVFGGDYYFSDHLSAGGGVGGKLIRYTEFNFNSNTAEGRFALEPGDLGLALLLNLNLIYYF